DDLHVSYWVRGDVGPLEIPQRAEDEVASAIACHIAQRVPDGATLQTGVGSLPDATLRGLSGHARLGIHSGVLGDAGLDLIERGAVTNACKGLDAGVTVTHISSGTRRL